MATLNGHAINWAKDLYHKIRDKLIKLHQKHLKHVVKMVRTTIGPHLTLLIMVAGAMDLQHEIKAGFHMAKTFSTNQPKRRRCVEELPPPPTLHSAVRVMQPKITDFKQGSAASTPLSQSSGIPNSIVIEIEEQ